MAAEPAIDAGNVAQIPLGKRGACRLKQLRLQYASALAGEVYRACIRPHAYAAGGRLSSRFISPLRRFFGGEDGSGGVETYGLWITGTRFAVRLGTRNKRLRINSTRSRALTKFFSMSF